MEVNIYLAEFSMAQEKTVNKRFIMLVFPYCFENRYLKSSSLPEFKY